MSDESSGPDGRLMLEILKDIQARMGRVEERLSGVEDRLGRVETDAQLFRREVTTEFAEVRASIARLDANTARGFEGMQRQLDGHRAYAVERDREFDERLRRLESHVPPHQP